MTTDNEQLATLRRMRNEGHLSDEEFDDLTTRLRAPVTDHLQTDEDPVEAASEDTTDDMWSTDRLFPPRFRQDLAVNHLAVLLMASVALLVLSALGALPWVISLPAILVLFTTLFEGWRIVTIVGAALVAVTFAAGLALSIGGADRVGAQPVAGTIPPEDPHPPIPGSLGIYMDQVTELWNTVDAPPHIVKGLTRYNEIGEYDTFLYRFDEWGRLGGAFDPENDAVYALLAVGQFSAGATDQLYQHLCYMVAPFSQECIESYQSQGLGGGTLEDFNGVTHDSEWTVGEHTWHLETHQNLLTIRVYGADAA